MTKAEKVRGHLDGLLLGVLSAGPAHGYALIAELRDRSGGEFDLPEGTVYPALHRLEHAGLVSSDWAPGLKRRRRIYSLTPDGRRELSAQRRTWASFAGAVSSVLGVAEARA
ncbi:MAG: helix-turn-helix transcriptional regulator [Sporichthyaceae bacterium]